MNTLGSSIPVQDIIYDKNSAISDMSPQSYIHMIQAISVLLLWIINFGVSLAGFVFSIFLNISHSDLDKGHIEPLELSDSLH